MIKAHIAHKIPRGQSGLQIPENPSVSWQYILYMIFKRGPRTGHPHLFGLRPNFLAQLICRMEKGNLFSKPTTSTCYRLTSPPCSDTLASCMPNPTPQILQPGLRYCCVHYLAKAWGEP
jgi:hypothetical protein